jgi:4'-phosphopantetheinyl transferase
MMDDGALPVRWWADGGFLDPWPSAALPTAGGAAAGTAAVRIVGVRGQGDRVAARRAIRTALSAALADSMGVPEAAVRLVSEPGSAPFASVSCESSELRRIGLAISHDGGVSLGAFRLDGGPVGIDVMQVIEVPDWAAVARDYLGPTCVEALASLPADARAVAFARAWSGREARLKCLGWPLSEWDAGQAGKLDACVWRAVAVPDGYVGTVAFLP